MFRKLGSDLSALQAAADRCGLVFMEGQRSFHFDTLPREEWPDWLANSPEKHTCDHCMVLSLESQSTLSRRPHEVGVFLDPTGCLWAVWDGYKEGFGLCAFVGDSGERLAIAYAMEAVVLAAASRNFPRPRVMVRANGYIEMTVGGNDMSATIIVRISPKGDATFQVEGVQGEGCKDLTKAVERALGQVVSDTPTPDMYKEIEQHHTVSG